MHHSSLHAGRLLHLLAFFGRRPQRRNNCQVLVALLSFAYRGERDAVKPVLDLRITGYDPAEELALQLRKLELLIGNRVFGRAVGLSECDLIVLPTQVTKSQHSGSRKLLERPVAAAFE